MIFSPNNLAKVLSHLPEAKRYLLAYSGGLDSHVLLHALSVLQSDLCIEILAVHVNHNISQHAEEWKVHAESVCDELGIKYKLIEVDASIPSGKSPEDWARQLRYRALEEEVNCRDILFTAHHKDDQAETLLLQLLRGAGPKGLASMPKQRVFGGGLHIRPLLGFTRKSLHDYAQEHSLNWIEDDTNCDTRYDRNYLREKVLPILHGRWTGLSETLTRAATNQADVVNLLEDLAKVDMKVCYQQKYQSLDVNMMKKLSNLRQGNLVRYYIQSQSLPAPDRAKLAHILNDVVNSKHDAVACVSWNGAEVRRYAEHLVAIKPLPAHDVNEVVQWELNHPCKISGETLDMKPGLGTGIKKDALSTSIKVSFRRGGEKIMPAGRKHHYELKKLFQEIGVPPWQRERIPLLFVDEKLIAVAGFWIDQSVFAQKDEEAFELSWSGYQTITQFNS